MVEEKCDFYKAKGILDYRKWKIYTAAAKDNKREETKSGQRERKKIKRIEMGRWARTKTSLQQEKNIGNRTSIPGTEKKGRKIKRIGESPETRSKTEQGKHKEKINKNYEQIQFGEIWDA